MRTARRATARNLTIWAAAASALLAAISIPVAEAQTPMTTDKAPQAAKTVSLPAGAVEMTLASIMDTQGFGQTMVAAKVLIPKGWKTQGGVAWNTSKPGCGAPAVFGWSATSPDGHSSFELFPTELWQASNSLSIQCQYGEFQDIRSYLTAHVMRRYPGARPGQYQPRPDFLDLQRQAIDAKTAMINSSGLGLRAWADAGELAFTFSNNGVELEGVVAATGMFYLSQTYNPLGGPPLMSLTGETSTTFAATGPKGSFDRKIVEAIRKSVKADGPWAEKYLDLLVQLGGIATQGVKDRAAIAIAAGAAMTANTIAANRAAGERAVRNSYADPAPVSRTGEATDDRMQRKRIDGLRGVETYEDPVYGGTVKLDNTYDHAWRVNNADSYILTNDPNFNPGLYNIDAQQLKVVQ